MIDLVVNTLVRAYGTMILLGIVHAEVFRSVNPVGYGTGIALAVAWSVARFKFENFVTTDDGEYDDDRDDV